MEPRKSVAMDLSAYQHVQAFAQKHRITQQAAFTILLEVGLKATKDIPSILDLIADEVEQKR